MVEAKAQTRALRDAEAAVLGVDQRGVVDEFADPRIGEIVEMLDDVHVPRRDRELDVGGGGDRATDVVRASVRYAPRSSRRGGASR